MKKTVLKIIILVIVILQTSCAITHKYGPYYGKLIDAETKEPIEGAAVLAVFYTKTWGLTVERSEYIDAIEVLTDKNGEFKIPAKRIITVRVLHGWDWHGYFTIFKPGYGCYPDHKDVKPMFVPNGALPVEEYVPIELPRLRASEERLRNQSCFPVSIPDEKMRKLIELNNIERVNLGLKPTHIQKEEK